MRQDTIGFGVALASAGPYANKMQTITPERKPHQHPPLNSYMPDALPDAQPCQSTGRQHSFHNNNRRTIQTNMTGLSNVKKHSPYSITERIVPELIPVLGSQPAGDVSHKPDGRLPLLSARPAVTLATLNRVATNFAAW